MKLPVYVLVYNPAKNRRKEEGRKTKSANRNKYN
jgi:hypothetical protein